MTDYFQPDVRICSLLKSHGFYPEVIYDIGASSSAWTRSVMPVWPASRYEMFEPQAGLNPDYDGRMGAFLGTGPNVRLHIMGLADKPGRMQLRVMGHMGVGASLLGDGGDGVPIRVETLDDLIARGVLAPPDFIKLDIQGAELAALEGGSKRALPAASVVVLETWLARSYGAQTPIAHEVMAYMTAHGYHLFDVGDAYREDSGVMGAVDFWFARNDSEIAATLWGADRVRLMDLRVGSRLQRSPGMR
jgi:FkbM family methyltransferase